MPPPPAVSAPPRSGLIDAWRALACGIVVFFHGTCAYPYRWDNEFLHHAADLGQYGWFGRNLLFLLSGYCLARGLERRGEQTAPLRFWRDRLLRIFPSYWAALLLACVLALLATPFNGLSAASAFPKSVGAALGDLSLTHVWLGFKPRLTVSWSLTAEIGFYLAIGLAFFRPFRAPRRRFALLALLTALSLLPTVPELLPLLALWPVFACGLAVQAALSPLLPKSFRLVALAYPAVLAFASFSLPGDQVAAPALASYVLLLCLRFEPRLPPAPRWLAAWGAASYSIFLAHMPLMSPAQNIAGRFIPQDHPGFVPFWAAHVLLGFAAGFLFYRWVETPLEKLRRRLTSSASDVATPVLAKPAASLAPAS